MSSQQFMQTSGALDPVWIHSDKHADRPKFPQLKTDTSAEVCIIGAGIAGISTAYELVSRGRSVCLVDARDFLSGETSRTTGHLSNALDDHYTEITKKHGKEGARAAAESHTWALKRIGDISKSLSIECEYRRLPGYEISQYERENPKHEEDVRHLREEAKLAKELGLDVEFREGLAIRGWDGKPDQRDAAIFNGQATFHPTHYLVGLLRWLSNQDKFKGYAHTRVMSVEEQGIELLGLGNKHVTVQTVDGHRISCDYAVEATNVPLQKLSVIAEMEYMRTFAVAIRIPRGTYEDCLIYDSAEPYRYIRFTHCDEKDDYLVIGGADHKVGQADDTEQRFAGLESWVRERFTQAGALDYRWSGQVFEPVDYMAFIGKNQGNERIYIVTGDSGNGLTHGVLASKLIADEMDGNKESESWAKLYSPKRLLSIAKSAGSMLAHDVQINTQYKRLVQRDIADIEDLAPGEGGVMNPTAEGPIAVYKAPDGQIKKMSALCPHMKGVVCWNSAEKSWDCPVHGSRFSNEGICVQGPAKKGLELVS